MVFLHSCVSLLVSLVPVVPVGRSRMLTMLRQKRVAHLGHIDSCRLHMLWGKENSGAQQITTKIIYSFNLLYMARV